MKHFLFAMDLQAPGSLSDCCYHALLGNLISLVLTLPRPRGFGCGGFCSQVGPGAPLRGDGLSPQINGGRWLDRPADVLPKRHGWVVTHTPSRDCLKRYSGWRGARGGW